jgi:hypothetical protein
MSALTRVSPWLRDAARAALALLAFALPFELVAPLARLGPLQLTSVELVLYAALALSAAAIAIDLLLEWPRLPWRQIAARHAGVIAFAVVLLLSALRAPLARPDAIKFALRNLGGIALYVAAANLLRAPAAALTTAVAITIGAVVASSLMWAELHISGAAAVLVPFHAGGFDVFGLPRASGPFQYPNIAAMYLEAALPVVLACGAAIDARRRGQARPTGTLLAVVASLTVLEGLALTASRAALLTAAVVVAGVGVHAALRRTRARWQAPAVLAAFALVAIGNAAFGSMVGLRMKFWNDGLWYRSTITPVGPVPAALAPSGRTAFDVEVLNRGARPWPATGERHIALSYHWRDDATGNLVVYDGVRTRLPRDLEPGGTARLRAAVQAPEQAGRYRLHLEMVHENTTWFGEQGDTGYDAVVDVGAFAPDAPPPAAIAPPPALEAPLERASRRTLWRAALMAWREHPVLGLGPDNFRHAYNRYVGLDRPDERLHANNLYLEILSGLGLAGIAALVWMIIGFSRAARAALRAHGGASAGGVIAAGAAAALAAYLVHGVFDYFLEFTPTYGLLWLLAGMLAALAAGETGKASE